MDKKNSINLIQQSIWRFISIIIGKGGSLIFIILIARLLKPEGFGIYNLAMSVVLIFAILADIGINQTLVRYVSYSLGKNKKSQAAAYMKYLLKVKLILVFCFSFILLIIAYPLSFYIFQKPPLFWPLIVLSFFLIVSSMQSFFEKLFYAIKNLKYLSIKEIIFQTSKILLVLLFFVILIEQKIIAVIIALILANLLTLLFLLITLRRITPFLFQKTSDKIPKKRVLNFLKYLTIGGLSGIFFGYVDMLMLGIFIESEYIGYYAAAFTLIVSVSSLISFYFILVPTFTQLKKSQLRQGFDKVSKYLCLLAIPMVFGALALGKYFIIIIYGYDYLSATIPFIFLSFLIFSFVMIEMFVSLFSAREKPKYFVKVLLIATFLNIILNYTLITLFLKISPEWAIGGAAIATLFSNYFYMSALIFFTNKKLQIKFKLSNIIKPLIASLFMFSILITINSFVKNMNLFIGIAEIISGATIYLGIIILLKGLTKGDYGILKQTFKLK